MIKQSKINWGVEVYATQIIISRRFLREWLAGRRGEDFEIKWQELEIGKEIVAGWESNANSFMVVRWISALWSFCQWMIEGNELQWKQFKFEFKLDKLNSSQVKSSQVIDFKFLVGMQILTIN
jgi:hypothetical protein